MKLFTVISTSTEFESIARTFMPPGGRIGRGADRLYFVYSVEGGLSAQFADVGGEVLVQAKDFESLAEAEAWVAADVKQRLAVLRAGGRAQ